MRRNDNYINELLYETAVDCMEVGDYKSARTFLWLSMLYGNHNGAIKNLIDDALDEDRSVCRVCRVAFYRCLHWLFRFEK